MPRPHTKNDLIEAADLNYDKFLKLINSMTEIELSKEFDFSSDAKKKEAHWGRDKNLRDILNFTYRILQKVKIKLVGELKLLIVIALLEF